MKVIREGRHIKGIMRVTCKKCEALLEIEASDLTKEDENKPESKALYRYTCPCCKRYNYLSPGMLSEDMLFDLNNQKSNGVI